MRHGDVHGVGERDETQPPLLRGGGVREDTAGSGRRDVRIGELGDDVDASPCPKHLAGPDRRGDPARRGPRQQVGGACAAAEREQQIDRAG